jgi:hypothetical protein
MNQPDPIPQAVQLVQQLADLVNAPQTQSSFVPVIPLQQNADFLKLMDMMNSMAAQLQTPVFQYAPMPSPTQNAPPQQNGVEEEKKQHE